MYYYYCYFADNIMLWSDYLILFTKHLLNPCGRLNFLKMVPHVALEFWTLLLRKQMMLRMFSSLLKVTKVADPTQARRFPRLIESWFIPFGILDSSSISRLNAFLLALSIIVLLEHALSLRCKEKNMANCVGKILFSSQERTVFVVPCETLANGRWN